MGNILQLLDRNTIETGGFHGIVQKRLVVNSKFGPKSGVKKGTWEGIGNLVYFADSWFGEGVETGLHPHQYIDVLTFVVEGKLDHEGSLKHGISLKALDFQVQKFGKEGFLHNEINKGTTTTRMLQLWLLPEQIEQKSSFRVHRAEKGLITNVYGLRDRNSTQIDVIYLSRDDLYVAKKESLVYVVKGSVRIGEENISEGVMLNLDKDIIHCNKESILISVYVKE